MRKIVFLFERSYFYENHRKQFGINKLKELGYSVELWSLAEWTFQWEKGKKVINPINEKTVIISDKESFDRQLHRVKKEKPLFFIYPYHAYSSVSYYVRRKICESNLYFINLTESPCGDFLNKEMPNCKGFGFWIEVLKEIIILLLKTLKYIFQAFLNFKERKKYLDKLKLQMIIFLGPVKYKSLFNVITTKMEYYTMPTILERNSRRNILANTSDYSLYLSLEKAGEECKILKGQKYIVFIDQGLTQYVVLPGEKKLVNNEEKYWKELNRFLDMVEKEYQCEVVIAVHPKAKYENGEYGTRKLIAGETINLIKYSYMNICMYSTAINFIILYEKPFIRIISDEIINGGNGKKLVALYDNFTNVFGGKVMNISKIDYNLEEYIYKYDKEKYDLFKNKCLVDDKGIHDKILTDIGLELVEKAFGKEKYR